MADLLKEFDAGRAAFLEWVTDCPFLETSAAANAWWAGREYERCRPSVYGPDRVWPGRGATINVRDGIGHPSPGKAPKFAYIVEYRAGRNATTGAHRIK